MAIRYDKKINQEINRTIKNFNQKIVRLEKQNREFLPSKISKKELKASVYNRNELKRKLAELQRFSARGAEEIMTTKTGVKMTNYEYKELKREATRVKRMVTRQAKTFGNIKPKIFGKEQTASYAQMGDSDYLNMIARRQALNKDINKLTKQEYERYKNLIKSTARNRQYMDNVFKLNYSKMLTDLGYYVGYPNEKLEELKEKIMKLEPDKFLKMFRTEKGIHSIIEYYPIMAGTMQGVNKDDIAPDVYDLYDSLIDNIDDIVKDYA